MHTIRLFFYEFEIWKKYGYYNNNMKLYFKINCITTIYPGMKFFNFKWEIYILMNNIFEERINIRKGKRRHLLKGRRDKLTVIST